MLKKNSIIRKENVYTVADLKRYEKNVTRSRKY